MVQIVTKTANDESKALNFPENLPPLSRRQNRKHHLRDVECVPPIVISNIPVVFLDTQQPTTQHFVIDVEAFDEVEIEKHSKTSLQCTVIVQAEIVEGEVMQLEVSCRGDFQLLSKNQC
jgi:hypothetical protein